MNRSGNALRPTVLRVRYYARRSLNRIDNEQVRRARGLLRVLRHRPPDVIYFGDSTVSYVGPGDSDRRRLDVMVADALGAEVSVHVVDGVSFNADIYNAYLRLITGTPHRPLIVVPLWTRGRFSPWIEHPIHGHKDALRIISNIDPGKPLWRVHASFKRPSEVEFQAFHATPYSTILGSLAVSDYLNLMDEYAESGDVRARVKMLFLYHHGGILKEDSPEIEAVFRMGRQIAELGCEAVVYQTPVPVEKGTELLGSDFALRTAESLASLNAAYRRGAGAEAEIIESGMCFASEEFIDPNDATEHLNDVGRRRLAELIVTEIKRRGPLN